MKSTARIAVVRVSRFAVERPVINPDMPPPPHAERAALALLQQNDADERDRDQDMDDKKQNDHADLVTAVRPARQGSAERVQRQQRAMAQKLSASRLAPPTSAPSTSARPRMPAAFCGLTEPP